MAARAFVLAMVVMLAGLPGPASAWEATIGSGSGDVGFAIVADAASRVVAGGALDVGTTGEDFAVLAFDATTGAELWRFVLDGGIGEPDFVKDLALDPSGDVIALGALDTGLGTAGVVKLDGATGAQLWRRDLPDPFGSRGLAVDGAGDVVVAAGTLGGDGALIKLDGVTGADVWQQPACGLGPIAVDASGDVMSAAFPPSVCKTDGATGANLWTQATGELVTDVAVDAGGDVLATGEGFVVLKLAGTTGAPQWQKTLGIAIFGDVANTVAVDAAGDVLAGGVIEAFPSDRHVVKLAGATGAEAWRGSGAGEVHDLVITSAGNVVGAADDTVTLFRASDGSPLWLSDGGAPLAIDASDLVASTPGDGRGWRVVKTGGPLAGRSLAVVETPAGTKLVLKVKDRAILLPQIVTVAGDVLNPTQVGAELELRNPSTAETDTVALPAVNWSSKKFGSLKYVDRDGSEGPCRKAKVTRKILKVSCKGSAFTLDEPTQGSLRATLLFGGDPLGRQCAEFGGSVRADVPGVFKATSAPPPPVCP